MKLLNKLTMKLPRYRKNATKPLANQRHLVKIYDTSSAHQNVELKSSPLQRSGSLRLQVISDCDHFNSSSYTTKTDRRNGEHYIEKPPNFYKKSMKNNFSSGGHFHEAVGRIFVIAECFTMMPVRGVTASHPRYLSFSWWSFRTIYSMVFIVCMVIDTIISIYKILHRPITFNNIEPLAFRLPIIIVCLSALQLARKWPSLMMEWHNIESDLPSYTLLKEKRQMAKKIRMVFLVGMMMSLAEHLLSIAQAIFYAHRCATTQDPIKNFLLIASEHLFYVFPYSNWLGFYGKTLNVMSTFIWNYMDVFVMIMSIGLSSMFQQLNADLVKFKNKQMSPAFWAERRVQYRNVCMLCEKVDNAISLITMVSFSNNLYFICVQLLKSLNKMPTIISMIYFYFSLLFLLGRTLAVSLYASAIHDESRKPLSILRCVPKESWCVEVKRFMEEISSDSVALSGMKFFYLTRKLVLSVAGTIVTYELVLIQFHESTNLWDCESLRRTLRRQQRLANGELDH
ncbi:gustatory receptor for sugar taste 64f-like [Haematobia irritans]|uniref:gustatory receptor for sugar taste 64f-like n=1 Tax=Haematobia irritans TaxID=7368 RepID=UPI003F500B91